MLLEIIDGDNVFVINLNSVFSMSMLDDNDDAFIQSPSGCILYISKQSLKKALANLKSNLVKPNY